MKAFQLVANGTEIKTRRNKNILSKKVFLDESEADKYKSEFLSICTHPIEGYSIFLDSESDIPIEIKIVDLELIGEIKDV